MSKRYCDLDQSGAWDVNYVDVALVPSLNISLTQSANT